MNKMEYTEFSTFNFDTVLIANTLRNWLNYGFEKQIKEYVKKVNCVIFVSGMVRNKEEETANLNLHPFNFYLPLPISSRNRINSFSFRSQYLLVWNKHSSVPISLKPTFPVLWESLRLDTWWYVLDVLMLFAVYCSDPSWNISVI